MIQRHNFFDKAKLLFGKYTQPQVDGLNAILDEWEKDPANTDIRQLAYILATVFHETGKTMQPVKEWGGEDYLRKKSYYPYYGRDLVQTTWKENYEKVKAFSGVDVVAHPELIAQMPLAAQVAIKFMKKGHYTGKKLADYFNETKEDAINARRIINGTYKAEIITGYYAVFKAALK
ncbi:MAG: hypothetical protein ACTHLB_05425 [Parafilimonas sp.]